MSDDQPTNRRREGAAPTGSEVRPEVGTRERPLFVDNQGGNTLERAIRDHLRALRGQGALPFEACIAAAFFNVPGFELLAADLERLPRVRLLLGAEPTPEAVRPERQPGDPTGDMLERREVQAALERLGEGLVRERDLLPFDRESDAAVRRLLAFLRSGKIDVRRLQGQYLHAKAFNFRLAGGGLLVGSSNLTRGGLRGNLELNLGHYDDPIVARVERWFDELWERAADFDLAAVYGRLIEEYPPYLIFLRVLLALYGGELAEETEAAGGEIPITDFQRHGVWRALRILNLHHGVLIADGVGLGKTYTAGEIVQHYRERRQRVLLICPAALRDSTWKEFLNEFQLLVESCSYEELAADLQLGGDQRKLLNPIEEYALVVVDEAHNYRNPDAPKRAGVLRRLLQKRPDLLMLSATPVNNSLWDLYHLLGYFLRQDAALAHLGVLSLRERFREAMAEDPFSLNPDVLYPVIDGTTVKRTRQFIKRHYGNDRIKGPDGTMVPIRFPEPVARALHYDLEAALPGYFDEVERALAPPDGHPRLTLARYQPESYAVEAPPAETDTWLVGLLRSGLLKRFESSIESFRRTLGRMIGEHEAFLAALDLGYVARKELLRELAGADDETILEELLEEGAAKVPAAGYRVEELRAEVERDLAVLRDLKEKAGPARSEEDPKLRTLAEELFAIAARAKDEAIDSVDERNRRKVLVFSAYQDTVDWIETFLEGTTRASGQLAVYRDRIASAAGQGSRRGLSRDAAVRGFAPESMKAVGVDDHFDILVATDVLAEGMNLQQCRHIINYDLPWNPMRLVQRHGRIDRINSRHAKVFLHTFFPDRQLDRLLRLEQRVRRKLAQAAASVGLEHAPIIGAAEVDRSFAETREEIEKLHREDPELYERGGTESAAQTGEEYRQQLRDALKGRRREIEDLPWKAGSGLVKGDRRGHVFCARVGDRTYLRFVPLHRDDKEIVGELGVCLRLLDCTEETERVLPRELADSAYDAWQRARGHILRAWTVETDPANLQPRLPRINRLVADFLRGTPPAEVGRQRLERVLEAVEAPCPLREQRELRAVFDSDLPAAAKASALIEKIEELGLQPYEPPKPLPPIIDDDIHLVCWMAVSPENSVPSPPPSSPPKTSPPSSSVSTAR